MSQSLQAAKYRPMLIRFMGFTDGREYPKTQTFTTEELLAVTPEHLVGFFSLLAYGMANPGSNDCPTHARHTTLYNYKKTIFHFMPHRTVMWDKINSRSNPTRSEAVNQMIKEIKT